MTSPIRDPHGRSCRLARGGLAALALVLVGGAAGCVGPTDTELDDGQETVAEGSDELTLAVSAPTAPSVADDVLLGIISLPAGPPTAAQITALRSHGLEAQALTQLPLAIVRGKASRIATAVQSVAGAKFYPDEPLIYHSAESNQAISVDVLHKRTLPLTGKGMTVAIMDSGIDATHVDLSDHVTHNVKMLSPEYASQPADAPPGSIIVPVDQGPYSNTDLNYGHGTMVAGVVAADGHTSELNVGVAPDAELIGYSMGDGVQSSIAMVAAYDDLLEHSKGGTKEDWGIDVVNNSWGINIWQPFDPAAPLGIATQEVAKRGIVVVFSGGNTGGAQQEMTLSTHGVAPWLLTAGGSTNDGQRWDVSTVGSSNGLIFDNSLPVPFAAHLRFTGDRLGLYHPTVLAPAADVRTTCTPTGLTGSPGCEPNGTTIASGTSFSAPHLAGVAALLKQARPDVTVAQVRQVLEATADPIGTVPFWQSGYGVVDAEAAVDLVTSTKLDCELTYAMGRADARELARRDFTVRASEQWAWDSPLASVAGVPDSRTLALAVPADADALKIILAYPSASGSVGKNLMMYAVTVKDASGQIVATTRPAVKSGVSSVFVELKGGAYQFGTWTLEVVGTLGFIQDPRYEFKVTLVASVLDAQAVAVAPDPYGFVEADSLAFKFQPDPARSTGQVSPEGCLLEPGEAIGDLRAGSPEGECHSASFGYPTSALSKPATFTSEPFPDQALIGGRVGIVIHVRDPLRTLIESAQPADVDYVLEEIAVDGTVATVATGATLHGLTEGRNAGAFDIKPYTVRAGSHLRLNLRQGYVATAAATMLFGGEAYGDAGIEVPTGYFEVPVTDSTGEMVVKVCQCKGKGKGKGNCK